MKQRFNDSGIALIVVLLLMLVFTVMLLGFYFETTGEQNVAYSDSDNAATFYAAQGAIENMSSALGQEFTNIASPTPTQIATLQGTTAAPTIAIYNTIGSLSGTNISFPVYSIVNLSSTNPSDPPCATTTSLCSSEVNSIPGTGPLSGLAGILTPFELTVVADGPGGSEVKMTRQVQVVAVPVFQFGIFSQTDLSFFAGPDFNFGGKTATNGNLFLAEGGSTSSPATLTLNDKVSAYLSVIREQLSNGTATQPSNYPGNVDITIGAAGGCPTPTCSGCPTATCGVLLPTQGSVTGGAGSTANSKWNSISLTTYGGYIKTSSTGAKVLNLNLAAASSTTPLIDMIERGQTGDTSSLVQERFFYQASVRILLSDTASDITSLPTVTSTAPFPLTEQVTTAQSAEGSGMGTGSGTYIVRGTGSGPPNLPASDSCHPPVAQSPGYSTDADYFYTPYTTLIGGYIKVEIQLASGAWQDVTQEILSMGISRDIQSAGTLSPSGCTNTSIIHLEGQRPLPYESAPGVSLATSTGLNSSDYYWYEVVPVVTINGVTGNLIPGQVGGGLKATSGKGMSLTWAAYTEPPATVTSYDIFCGSSSSSTGGPAFIGYYNTGSTATSYTDTNCSTGSGNLLTADTSPPTTFPTVLNTSSAATTATNYVPINLYDPREGEVRDSNSYTTASMNGVMNVVEIDVGHLQQWLTGKLLPAVSGCTGTAAIAPITGSVNSCGPLAVNNSGYILYVSDRRSNCNQSAAGPCQTGNETGVYGYEDIVNPLSGTGTPNNTLDTGEGVDADLGSTTLDIYGGTARPINCYNFASSSGANWPTGTTTTLAAGPSSGCSMTAGSFMAGLTSPSTPVSAPLTRINSAAVGIGYLEAQKNPVLFFRRAVRLVDGSLGNLPPYYAATGAGGSPSGTCPNMESPAQYPSSGGFSVATEGPLYILGDYNAVTTNANGFSKDLSGQCHVPAAVFADAVTLLSNSFTDSETFMNPTSMSSRPQADTATWYRVAVIGGKNISFPIPTFTSPAAPPQDFGTDGGVHNFLRYIENWNTTLNYMGAMVSFYYAHQGTGTFKCCDTVYNPPTRAYSYDSDFTNITSLPPGTPRFTDVNALSYNQATLATQ